MDELTEVFNVERPLHEVWEACRLQDEGGNCRIPAFPSPGGDGCAATVLESRPQRLLRARKDDMPCAGTEIEIRMEPATAAGWPTRVTLRQSSFPPAFVAAPEVFDAHFRQIAANFHLYLERGIRMDAGVPADFGASLVQTALGLELRAVTDGGLADACGMATGDLLLTVGGVRIHNIGELWVVLAARSEPALTVTWARGPERMEGSASVNRRVRAR
ncbi:MAG: hypothetical protein OXI55_05585 [Gammaproteobacteria bacterium]|nr:hypothetical protein [Gammaproteobacteria bacterium]